MFIKKPLVRCVRTRQDYIAEQEQKQFFIIYALFFISFISIIALVRYTFGEEGDSIEKIQQEICLKTPESSFCDLERLKRIDTIAKKKWVPIRLIIWIAFAESTNDTNYNKPVCKTRNNPYWLKGRKYDGWEVRWFTNDGHADDDGCYLYQFKSLEEATESLVNTISMWYRTCHNNTVCISYSYCGDPSVSEASWVARVEKFYPSI